MSATLIKNIGTLVTGMIEDPLRDADSILVADGVIREVGNGLGGGADRTIDANGTTVIPGLIDSHSHPTFGNFTPAQNSIGWITHYMHGGVTSIISAGELHVPGLPLPPDPLCAVSLAIVAKRCWDNLRPTGVRVHGGTLLLVPGLEEKDFDTIAEAGIRLVKFIFYDYSLLPNGEAERYVKWARARDMKVKIHSGGVSRSGVSQVAGVDIVKAIDPDVIGHSTGGPIPMPEEDLRRIVAETEYYVEICTSGNLRMGMVLADAVRQARRRGPGAGGHRHSGRHRGGAAGHPARDLFPRLPGGLRAGTRRGHGHRQHRARPRTRPRHHRGREARGPRDHGPHHRLGIPGCAGFVRQGRPSGYLGGDDRR